MLPNEIVLEIFSHMDMEEVYKMGWVCRSWKHQRDLAIALNLQQSQAKILICTSPKLVKNNTMDLGFSCHEDGWFDFVPTNPSILPEDTQGVRMVFETWPHDPPTPPLSLSPLQQAHYVFHHTFVAIHQQLYLLADQRPRFWIGDESIGAFILVDQHHVVLARVSISWLLSRPTCFSSPPQLGPDPVLRMDTTTDYDVSTSLGRWGHLQLALRARSIDPAVTWKYHLAKLYLLGKSSLDLDPVVAKIVLNEKEWELEKPKLIKATQSHRFQDRLARLFQ